MSELLNEEVEAAIDEMVEESIVDTYYRMGYILYEEDLTSARARKAASKAAAYMDTDHEQNVKREMAKETIRTGKDASREKAQVKAIENDKSGNAPASAKRVVKAKRQVGRAFRKAKVTPVEKQTKTDTQTFGSVMNQKALQQRRKNVEKAGRVMKTAKKNPLDSANRTVQRVIDRESRATKAGFGPREGESTADNIKRARAMRRKVKKETPKGSN